MKTKTEERFTYTDGSTPFAIRRVGRTGLFLATKEQEGRLWALTHKRTALAVARSPRLSDIRSLAQEIEAEGTVDAWTFTDCTTDPSWDAARASQELAAAMLALILRPSTREQRATGRRLDQPGAARLLREALDGGGFYFAEGQKRSPAGLWSLLIEQPIFGIPHIARYGVSVDEDEDSPIFRGLARNIVTGETRKIVVTEQEAAEGILDAEPVLCSGPCECSIEPDGQCCNGWPSRLLVAGLC